MGSTVLVSAFHMCDGWVGLGWVKKNGPTSISGSDQVDSGEQRRRLVH